MPDFAKWVAYLLEAESRRKGVPPITETEPSLSAEDAYTIQALVIAAKVSAGERVLGAKLGLTSKPKQAAMHVEEPVYGVLTSAMALEFERPLVCAELIEPCVVPEIAFILGDELAGPGVTGHDVLDATRWLTCGLEVIDSRFAKSRITHADVVADNAGAARFMLGSVRKRLSEIPDLSLLGCNMQAGGDVVATAAGAAILGHPASAVAMCANHLGKRSERLGHGAIVLSGGLTNPVPVHPGSSVSATFAHLGSVSLRAI